MARRIVLAAPGMRISKPGYDALTASEDDLLFSTARRHLMMIGAGGFFLSNGYRVDYGLTLGQVPLVICGTLNDENVRYPVDYYTDTSGFTAYARARPDGATPALGRWCQWVAFMREQG